MKDYGPNEIRNIGLVSHQSVGKTTLAEAMLFSAGVTNRLGTIEDGSTTSDYRTDEIERKISISTSLAHFEWKDRKFNLVDMPGYLDFIGEVRCGLRVADLAVVLLDSIAGVEVGTEIVWEVLQENKTPRVFFINHVDKENSNFDKAVADARDAYGNAVVAVHIPINQGEGFNSRSEERRVGKECRSRWSPYH